MPWTRRWDHSRRLRSFPLPPWKGMGIQPGAELSVAPGNTAPRAAGRRSAGIPAITHASVPADLRPASLSLPVPGATLTLCPRLVSSGPVGRQTFGLCRLTPVAASGMHRNERRGRLGCDSRKARAEHAQASCRPSACLSFARGSWGDADALPQAGFLWPGGPTDLRPVSADAGGPPPGYTGTSAEANWAASRVRHGPSMPKLPADLRPASRSLPVPGATLMLCPRLGSSGPVGWQTFGLCRLTPVGRLRDAQERAPRPTGLRLAQGT
jgi:hypothetical protein